jgi:hypothetical protein
LPLLTFFGKKQAWSQNEEAPALVAGVVHDKLWKHPETGLVMRAVKRPERPHKQRPPRYIHDGDRDVVDFTLPVFDAVYKDTLNESELRQAHGRLAYAKSKRALSGDEIKKLGLSDKFAGDPPAQPMGRDELNQPLRYNLHGQEL